MQKIVCRIKFGSRYLYFKRRSVSVCNELQKTQRLPFERFVNTNLWLLNVVVVKETGECPFDALKGQIRLLHRLNDDAQAVYIVDGENI